MECYCVYVIIFNLSLQTMYKILYIEVATRGKEGRFMKKRWVAAFLAIGLMFGNLIQAQSENISFAKVEEAALAAIKDEVTPGMQIVVTKGNEIVYSKAFGTLDGKTETTTDTIYDLASVTKVMATTQAIMKLKSAGKIDLEAPVAQYIPEFAQNGKEKVKIKDLLTHTSGLTPWKPTYFHATNPKEELEFICKLPLEYPTGTARKYSDFSFMALGYVVEAITGKTLQEYTEQEIYKPLGMNHTMFVPLKHKTNYPIAPTSLGNPFEYKMVADDDFGYKCEENADDFKGWRNYRLVGEVNDGNSWYAQQGVAGHAGLFSNAEDLSKLTRLMLAGGSFQGVTLYDAKTIQEFTTVQSEFGHGYGFEIDRGGATSGYMGLYADSSFFGHTGFTGTQFVADKRNDISVIILTNKQFFGVNEKGNYKSTWPLARNVMKAVYESGLVTYSGQSKEVKINYQGKETSLPGYFSEDRNYVELEAFLALVGAEKTVTAETQTALPNRPNGLILHQGEKAYPVRAFTVEQKNYVHIRNLAGLLNLEVKWDAATGTVELLQK